MVRTIRTADLGGAYHLPEAREADGWVFIETPESENYLDAEPDSTEPLPKRKSSFNQYPLSKKKGTAVVAKQKPTPTPKLPAKPVTLRSLQSLPKPVALDLGTKPKEVKQIK